MAMSGQQQTNLNPAIILVEPQMGENIGAAARVMHNFGLTDLRIVNPRDGWPNQKAIAMASGATAVIDFVRVFDTTEEAVGDLQGVFAATARRREMAKPVVSPREAIATMREDKQDRKFGILFGRERSGLTNEDVVLADTVLTVPLNPAFQSLNLAQAVAVMAYECFTAPPPGAQPVPETGERPATKEELIGMLDQLENSLDEAGYFAPVPEKKPSMVRNLRNIFQRAELLEQDVRTLRGIIKALARRTQRGTTSDG